MTDTTTIIETGDTAVVVTVDANTAPKTTKLVTWQRVLSTAAGSQSITGVGFKPSMILFQTGIVGGSIWGSSGVTSPDGQYCTEFNFGGALYSQPSFAGIQREGAGSNYQTFTVSSFDADGFTLAWAKTGTPTATANIAAVCIR